MKITLISAHVVLTLAVATNAFVNLKADLSLVHGVDPPIAVFRCTTGNDQMFYLSHILTWSKIGQDGREKYLTINWNVQPEAKAEGYEVASQIYWDNSTSSYKLFFVLSKGALLPEDQGEYICRVHDMDRNLLAEQSVQTAVLENGLAISPYQVETDTGRDVAFNCLYNATNRPITNQVTVSHMDQGGAMTKIATNGQLASQSLAGKYEVMSYTEADGTVNNVITIKALTMQDTGYIVCETTNNDVVTAKTKSKIIVGRPKLEVFPMFYLQMPLDSAASFRCHCDVTNTGHASSHHSLAWSLKNSQTGKRTFIYKDGKLLGNPSLYSVSQSNDGMTVTLNISALSENTTEGDYICSMHDRSSQKEVSSVAVPTSVNPISVQSMILMDQYPAVIRFLCMVIGAHWDTHYLETHTLQWRHVANGAAHVMSENGNLSPNVDTNRFKVLFNGTRGFSVLDINSITKHDYGNYECLLLRNSDNSVLMQDSLAMFGKGNSTMVG